MKDYDADSQEPTFSLYDFKKWLDDQSDGELTEGVKESQQEETKEEFKDRFKEKVRRRRKKNR